MKIDCKVIAHTIFRQLKKRVSNLKAKNPTTASGQGIIPKLVIILIDKDPASLAYVNQKEKKGKKIGVKISVKHLSSDVSEPKLLTTIEQFNNENNIHGIIVQRPIPKAIDKNKISQATDPEKDVDGFHPESKFQPPLALTVLRILEEIYQSATPRMVARQRPRLLGGGFQKWLTSKKILVIGKGETGGKPVIDILKNMNIEHSIIDSKTPNPQALTKKADIIISCVGKPNVIKPEMLKKEVILIGVGLHKGTDAKMHGDYDQEKIKNIASFYTPTPGGVGPVNVAMLLENLVTAAENFYLSKSTEA